MADTMRIWGAVSKTDPDHTKRVNQRGGFTAIDAHYQIECATRQFGPVGEGWGYHCEPPIFQGEFVIVPVSVWHGDRTKAFGPIYGCAAMTGNRPDSDAPKKAMTDAITKGLSHLGFNADVFLGKFDDSKYVDELRAEKQSSAAKEAEKDRDPIKVRDGLLSGLAKAADRGALKRFLGSDKYKAALAWLLETDEPKGKEVAAAAVKRDQELNGESPADYLTA